MLLGRHRTRPRAVQRLRHAPSHRVAATVAALLLACLSAGAPAAASVDPALAGVATEVAATQEPGTPLLAEPFTGSTVTTDRLVVGSRGTYPPPCLTAGDVQSSPAACTDTTAPQGEGMLRLTVPQSTLGWALHDSPLPTKGGLDITFRQYQYGGTNPEYGGQGIVMFLADGRYPLSRAGGWESSLGYNRRYVQPGLPHGLIGVGIDAHGMYPHEQHDPACGPQPLRVRDAISVRGPAADVTNPSGTTKGYCVLTDAAGTTSWPVGGSVNDTALIGHTVRVVVDAPSSPEPMVRVWWDDPEGTGAPLLAVPQPAELVAAGSVRLGFAASSTSNFSHAISHVDVHSVLPVAPELSPVAADGPVVVEPGDEADVTLTTTVRGEGGPEGEPVVLTASASPGVRIAGTPTSTDPAWRCTGPGPDDTATCTWVPIVPLRPGTVLPPVVVPVTSGGSGHLVARVTSDDAQPGPYDTLSRAVVLRPTAQPLDGEGVAAAEAVPVVLGPGTTVGGGPFAYELAEQPAWGTASVEAATGEVTFVPDAGASGRAVFSYRARDTAHDVVGPPATVTVTVLPAVPQDGQLHTPYATEASVDLSAGALATAADGGDLVYSATQPTGGAGTVTMQGSTAVLTPAEGFSGTGSFSWTVTGRDGVTSRASTVEITVAPSPGTPTAAAATAAAGSQLLRLAAATPSGSGPFTYRLPDQPDPGVGSASIDPSTGRLTLALAPGISGRLSVAYVVTDADGASAVGAVPVDVRPRASDGGLATAVPVEADGVAAFGLPRPVGVGPFVYDLAVEPAADQASVRLDAVTGDVTAVPVPGYTGKLSFAYTVTDGAGLTSDPAVVHLDVVAPAEDAAPDQGAASGAQPGAGQAGGPPAAAARGALALTGSSSGDLALLSTALLLAGVALQVVPRARR